MTKYIKSPLNYTGGKYKILQQILCRFPEHIDTFVDLFSGGLNVGINVNSNALYVNDQITYLIDIYRLFKETNTHKLLKMIKDRIKEYNLSNTNIYGYNSLRLEYNKNKSILDLLILSWYSFNNQIRFNNKHEFNSSFGERQFNDSIENRLVDFCDELHKKNVTFSSLDFRSFDYSILKKNDVIYCDPPYTISRCSYNDGKRGFNDWNFKDDLDLFEILDNLNNRGVVFYLSNVFNHKGQTNDALIEWSKKYNIIYIDNNYNNCNYYLKNKGTKTIEVLVNNY